MRAHFYNFTLPLTLGAIDRSYRTVTRHCTSSSIVRVRYVDLDWHRGRLVDLDPRSRPPGVQGYLTNLSMLNGTSTFDASAEGEALVTALRLEVPTYRYTFMTGVWNFVVITIPYM